MTKEVKYIPWEKDEEPTVEDIEEQLEGEDVSYHRFRFAKGEYYPDHTHPNAEIRIIINGKVEFGVKKDGEEETYMMEPGDRLELPPKTKHWAKAHEESLSIAAKHC